MHVSSLCIPFDPKSFFALICQAPRLSTVYKAPFHCSIIAIAIWIQGINWLQIPLSSSSLPPFINSLMLCLTIKIASLSNSMIPRLPLHYGSLFCPCISSPIWWYCNIFFLCSKTTDKNLSRLWFSNPMQRSYGRGCITHNHRKACSIHFLCTCIRHYFCLL